MRGRRGRDLRAGQPHSERSGEASLETGERAELYRALRDLSCSRCGGLIQEGDLFTREAEPASGLPLVRCCRVCVPFKPCGSLLDALFTPEGRGEATPTDIAEGAREKMLSRLGPALSSRKKQSRDDGD